MAKKRVAAPSGPSEEYNARIASVVRVGAGDYCRGGQGECAVACVRWVGRAVTQLPGGESGRRQAEDVHATSERTRRNWERWMRLREGAAEFSSRLGRFRRLATGVGRSALLSLPCSWESAA